MDRGDVMSDYTRVLNERRRELLAKYGFPSEQDYCILLDWCSDDIPENVTLIDLPGTGASTDDAGARSSHTTLVRGILNEADAIWVLCTDNGTIDRELASVLNDVISRRHALRTRSVSTTAATASRTIRVRSSISSEISAA